MQLICPQCSTTIPASAVNIAADLAKCESCGELFKASELVADVDLQSHLSPPAGSRITFARAGDTSGAFQIPRSGLKRRDLPMLAFATLWITFVAAWTAGVAFAAGLVALISLPFWLVGFGLWVAFINAARGRQTLEVTPEQLIVHKTRPFFAKRIPIAYDQVEAISLELVTPRDAISMLRHLPQFCRVSGAFYGLFLPCVTHGTRKTFFAEDVSEPEMKWLAKILKGVVFKVCGKKV